MIAAWEDRPSRRSKMGEKDPARTEGELEHVRNQ